MKRHEYFVEASRLSNSFGQKMEAVEAFLEKDPELKEPGALDKYWELENEAQAAAGQWVRFCSENRPLIRG
ncbi:hypothetical protein JH25_07910 [Pseudomonas sp. BRG-100]|uniref:hypothetical protein n=1 Tax=Pseudomonas sp. BRG-100 TaxID=1524267 RepID=UPI0004E7674C|nr:hypothetical protein [Pseudomonas sp. BRG-100]KFF43698.1 hypothetical protein JH25_07910 [Pseudomonas sp. BRG-100]